MERKREIEKDMEGGGGRRGEDDKCGVIKTYRKL